MRTARIVATGMNSSSARDSWRTPAWLYEALNREFGFDLDPCPYQPNWAAGTHQDGLELDWDGKRVFCNPPYSNIKPWVEKAFASAAFTVLLLPAWTDRDWFQILHERHAEIRYFRHRVNFIPPNGVKSSTNNCGSIVAIIRNSAHPKARNVSASDGCTKPTIHIS